MRGKLRDRLAQHRHLHARRAGKGNGEQQQVRPDGALPHEMFAQGIGSRRGFDLGQPQVEGGARKECGSGADGQGQARRLRPAEIECEEVARGKGELLRIGRERRVRFRRPDLAMADGDRRTAFEHGKQVEQEIGRDVIVRPDEGDRVAGQPLGTIEPAFRRAETAPVLAQDDARLLAEFLLQSFPRSVVALAVEHDDFAVGPRMVERDEAAANRALHQAVAVERGDEEAGLHADPRSAMKRVSAASRSKSATVPTSLS